MPTITGRHLGTWSHVIDTSRVYVDGLLADYFLVSEEAKRTGLPLQDFFGAIDEADRDYLTGETRRAIADGSVLDIFYHVNTHRGLRVVRVVGRCYYRDDGAPFLFSGATFDATPSDGALINAVVTGDLDEEDDQG
ncbi:hypothetical protein [Tianweitania sediminis]|jgi:hypothetical protein|uniref:PAS domain-containing protein n=1 Tax=Tianweitania sediminis TaxID=1502156 RepID=A0A8J7QZA9_9HYPH|nr:hypothetical protein [Tianweitania sediminis]MBP0439538.1 hypothetical protein [Tianweitania sediminis]HEV7418117.1 hypothetical protein [Tianweitania sediminis]